MKTVLQIHTANQLIGKTIKWTATGSRENGLYNGLSKITAVDPTNRRPITSETLEGDNLDFAFVNQYSAEDVEFGLLSYSDGDRYVTFEEVK